MKKLQRIETKLSGLCILKPKVFSDSRGYLLESYNRKDLLEVGIDADFVQDNVSCSGKGILRGLHFQTKQAQDKLVKSIRGKIFDVAVDLRKGSPSFGKWEGIILDDKDHLMLFVPKGFAHGFLVLSEMAHFHYKCSNYYAPEHEGGVIWNDPQIGIRWPLEGIVPLLSPKDRANPLLCDMNSPFIWTGKQETQREEKS